ncbi:hypothetical protein MBGDF03_00835 [Thermoplasmatales archaeon SCGC AB-540-F20]|nr:hypothetical protein MBGDF03_00835 [Thermoplasmatales archaeon SCGC AB-540-F20]
MINSRDSKDSKLLEMAIKRYQFDVVGWTEYCIDNKILKHKELPVYRQKPLENLRISDKILSGLSTPSIKKVYDSPNHYIQYLAEEYVRDQAFYEAILKNPGKFKTDNKDILLNKEIDHSAKEYLKTIEKRKIDEEALIGRIHNDKWLDVKMSKYPKVQLGLILGISKEAIVNNFGLYFMNLLKGHFAGSRTAFLSSTGPASWYELEQSKAELAYFNKEVVKPCIEKHLSD